MRPLLRHCWLSLGFFMGSLALVLGCGGSSSSANLTVSGKVTVKGAPAKNVMIKLSSHSGAEFQGGPTDEQGKFTISGVTPGEMQVSFSEVGGGTSTPGMNAKAQAKMNELKNKELRSKGVDLPETTTVESTKIPHRYTDKTKSGLTWNVTPDNLTKDFPLE
jgi:hypothetical protein